MTGRPAALRQADARRLIRAAVQAAPGCVVEIVLPTGTAVRVHPTGLDSTLKPVAPAREIIL